MKTIQSIDKTMHILNYIAEHNGQVTLTDISRNLQIAITTVHGFVSTLEFWHILSKDESGRYSLGSKLFHLSLYCQQQQHILALLHPVLHKLSTELQETLHLGITMGDQLVYADRAEPSRPFRTTAVVGECVPYYDSAIGLVIKVANNEIIPQEYLVHCNNIAYDGYCSKFEPEMHAYCIGVPFLQPGLPCISGLSAVIPQECHTPERVAYIVSQIRSAFQTAAQG